MGTNVGNFEERARAAWQAAGEANGRQPSPEGWGFFSSQPAPSGMGAFCWFDSRTDALSFLAKQGPLMFAGHNEDGSQAWEERSDAFRAEVARALHGELTDEELRLAAQRLIDPQFQLDWIGPVRELLSGDTRFAVDVRASLSYEDEDAGASVPPEREEEFLDRLATYGA